MLKFLTPLLLVWMSLECYCTPVCLISSQEHYFSFKYAPVSVSMQESKMHGLTSAWVKQKLCQIRPQVWMQMSGAVLSASLHPRHHQVPLRMFGGVVVQTHFPISLQLQVCYIHPSIHPSVFLLSQTCLE